MKHDAREIGFLRGQSLNLAVQESLEINERKMDLDTLFVRAKEIFDKALEVGFLEWGKTEKPSLYNGYETASTEKPTTLDKSLGKHSGTLEDFDAIQVSKSEWDWAGNQVNCPTCGLKIPDGLPVHEKCGHIFNQNWNALKGLPDTQKICRRCGQAVPKTWKKCAYNRRTGKQCGYEFKEKQQNPKQEGLTPV